MIRSVKIRGVSLGAGAPKICVPLVGLTKEELLNEITNLKKLDFDLIEWRVDFFEGIDDVKNVLEIAHLLRQQLEGIPILFTFRSKKEGGEHECSEEAYFELIQQIIKTKYIDLVDIELDMPETKVKETIRLANQNEVKVILSNHDFDKTPPQEEIVKRLKKMQKMGADICKIAVMPQSSKDVLTLLQATHEMYTNFADRPIVTMSMSKTGMISRLSGEIFGSAMTFGSATKASAPGQIPVGELRKILTLLTNEVS